VRFRGTPFAMSAVLSERGPEMGPCSVSLRRPKAKGGPIECEALADDDPRVLRLVLPRFTPPGTYEGTVQVDGEDRPVVVEVEPDVDVRLFPEELTIRAHPGDMVGVDLTVLNKSNVPVEVARTYVFGIFMRGGIERAIRTAYTHKLQKDQRRADVLVDTLADAHGGLVKVKVTEGSGAVEPDEARDLEAIVRVSRTAVPGRSYTGNLEIHGAVLPVRFIVEGDSKREDDTEQEQE
jgi:hypothetical protein